MEPAIVTIQLGQCGNQVGAACFEGLASQLLAPAAATTSGRPASAAASAPPTLARPSQRTPFQQTIARRFFREEEGPRTAAASSDGAESTPLPRARAVLIDMEPKVIQAALSSAAASRLFRYSSASSFYRQSGSGNNWSYGFGVHGPQCRDEILERVRREVERAPSLGGFLVHQSLAGGTGSGVGAYLTECMHDEYPGEQLINQVVWPYSAGEVIVQNYNALLTLAHLSEFSHGILLFENDTLHQICSRRLHVRTPTFKQLNRIIAENLTNALLPARVTQAQPFYNALPHQEDPMAPTGDKRHKPKLVPPTDEELLGSCPPLHLWSDPLSHLFAHPGYSLSTIRTIPQLTKASKSFQASSWPYLLKHLLQMQLCGSDMEDGLDFSRGSFAKHAPLAKRKWHRHFSASAAATNLYDAHSYHEPMVCTPHPQSASSPAAAAAAAATSQPPSSSVAATSSSSTSAPVFDAPLAAPAHLAAFIDGESYLECRLRLEAEAGSASSSSSPSAAASANEPPSYNSTLSALLYLRGSSVCSADATTFLDPSLYASGTLSPLVVARASGPTPSGDERLATLWSNSAAVARPLDAMLDQVYAMLRARAYVHHYDKYGIDREHMWHQVAAIEQIASDYRNLAYQASE